MHFLEQLSAEVHALAGALGRNLVVIAESDLNDPRLIRPAEAGGYGLDAQWSDDFHHALHSVLTGERDGYYADFGALDGPRRDAWSRAIAMPATTRVSGGAAMVGRQPGLDGRRLLGYLQNHDQVGNRALGERSCALMSPGRVLIGAAVVLTAPFVPMLFQGEEWAASTPFQYFTDHEDPESGRCGQQGSARGVRGLRLEPRRRARSTAIPRPSSAPSSLGRGFVRSTTRRSLAWHRDLIALRRRYPELTDGRLAYVGVEFDEDERWFTVTRGRVTVAFNIAQVDARVAVKGERLELASDGGLRLESGELLLPADSVAIVVSD